jgi:thioredoxin-like negative regulator of GroEL
MNTVSKPDALLLLTSQCPHCPSVLTALSDLVKRGEIGRLEAVNIEQHPDIAAANAVRSVPWLRIGPFQLTGTRSLTELQTWAQRAVSADGMSDAFHDLLKQADLAQVLQLVAAEPARLATLLPIVANPEASLNVKLGVGVVFDEYAGTPTLQALLPPLGELSQHADARVRADACHLLGLAGSSLAKAWLQAALQDENPDVREIAAESLDTLGVV